uniref:Uncharacterized protein n=1 Tax=Anguilla anguilla TaxID=7936 RepID=A0A0E9U9L6_ANGAN
MACIFFSSISDCLDNIIYTKLKKLGIHNVAFNPGIESSW